MKLKKLWNKKDENQEHLKFCKKCGVELVSTNKSGKCDNCKGIVISYVKKGFLTLGGIGSIILLGLIDKDKNK